jgi:signal peptidase I
MNPTLRDGGWAVVFTEAYRFHPPQRGDLVMVSTGTDLIIKRVVGLPGETVAIHESHVLINNELLPELYVKHSGHWEVQPGEIGAGRYAIVGDNRSGSRANALLAVVRQDRILGKVVYY